MSRLMNMAIGRIDKFLFHDTDASACVRFRITFAVLLCVYVTVWMLDGTYWFSDAGVLQTQTARAMSLSTSFSLFWWIPSTPLIVQSLLGLMLIQSVALLIGLWSRFQIICICVLLVSFQNRNPLLMDGEDVVIRLFAFYMIFMPLDHSWSLSRWLRKPSGGEPETSAWAIRLPQVQMTVIYLSAVWSKCLGSTWIDGSAMFYVYKMSDVFGRGQLPLWLTQSPDVIRLSTWSVLLVEAVLPIALWYRPTRTIAVVVGIMLHLSMEYAMHLFLFQWIMIVGLLSFLAVPLRFRSKDTGQAERFGLQ